MSAGLGLDVGSVAQTILAALESHYAAAAGITLPERRFLAPGAPELIAIDCPCAVVTCSGVGNGQAPGVGGGPQKAGSQISSAALRHVIYAVQVWRPVPEATRAGTKPPPVERLTEAGLMVMRDAGLISQALVDICTAVDEVLPRGSLVAPGAVTTLGPEGGYAGNQATLSVTAGMLV